MYEFKYKIGDKVELTTSNRFLINGGNTGKLGSKKGRIKLHSSASPGMKYRVEFNCGTQLWVNDSEMIKISKDPSEKSSISAKEAKKEKETTIVFPQNRREYTELQLNKFI
jgi:hypothetical protein